VMKGRDAVERERVEERKAGEEEESHVRTRLVPQCALTLIKR